MPSAVGVSLVVLSGLIAAAPASAQTQPVNPQAARQAARQASDAAAVMPSDEIGADRTAPLAAGSGKSEQRILSRNELYNLERAAQGRMGVRVGNDMSFPVGGN